VEAPPSKVAHQRVTGPTQRGTTEQDQEVREGRKPTSRPQAYAGSRLKPGKPGKAPPEMPTFQPYWGNPPYGCSDASWGSSG
jgi:hypothetical protein